MYPSCLGFLSEPGWCYHTVRGDDPETQRSIAAFCVCVFNWIQPHSCVCVPPSLPPNFVPSPTSLPLYVSVCVVRVYPGCPVRVILVLLLFSCPAENIQCIRGGGRGAGDPCYGSFSDPSAPWWTPTHNIMICVMIRDDQSRLNAWDCSWCILTKFCAGKSVPSGTNMNPRANLWSSW